MSQQKPKDTVWSKYGYLWVTLGLFIASLVGHWLFAWYAFVAEQAQHGQSPEVQDFVIQTIRDTLENWQSEFLQLLTFVILTSFLIHRGSHESKDTDEQMQAALTRIEQRLERLEQGAPRHAAATDGPDPRRLAPAGNGSHTTPS